MKTTFKNFDKILTEVPVSEIMTKNPVIMTEDKSVEEAISLMVNSSISGLLVVNAKDHPVGIVTAEDILKHVVAPGKSAKKIQIKSIMSKNLMTIKPTDSIQKTATIMKTKNVSKFPVLQNKKLVGFVTKSDLLQKLNEIIYQNARLKWLPAFNTILLIIIVALLLAYIQK